MMMIQLVTNGRVSPDLVDIKMSRDKFGNTHGRAFLHLLGGFPGAGGVALDWPF